MKWLLILFVSGFATFTIVRKDGFEWKGKNTSIHAYQSFAVLELFTSEGCSSCPPADLLLPQLAAANPNIIPLSFHVDYWDRLGWKDPFSSAEFSQRQQDYARQLGVESIYTPQLIINGKLELVGSNRSTAEADIKKVLNEKAAVTITIDKVMEKNKRLAVECTLAGALDQTVVAAALVQKHAEMSVKAGENRGAKLSHTNVVRSFAHKPAKVKMEFEIDVPSDLNSDSWELILYSQQKKDLQITGVAVWEKR
ncbi:MAG TPA: DUF1223 domain-containing protein [Chitinophagaceae bacterium]|nr:DUF1223 domain-containing protein [Chitinophagaceae bacterium]